MASTERNLENVSQDVHTMSSEAELSNSLKRILQYHPPELSTSSNWKAYGLYIGPTSIAYLFFRIGLHNPSVKIDGKSLSTIGYEYLNLAANLAPLPVNPDHCGVGNDTLAQLAIRTMLEHSETAAQALCAYSATINVVEGGSDEWLFGRAGYLYLLRVALSAFESGAHSEVPRLIQTTIEQTVNRILASSQPWTWHGKEYLGAVHGSIGIMCQLVLSMPSISSRVEPTLRQFLAQQLTSGNFPSSAAPQSKQLVQVCHGSPGVVLALSSMRPYFPHMQPLINDAIAKATDDVWKHGLLTKDPCLCHGIAGNALALASESQFQQFLSYMTTENLRVRGWLDGAGKTDEFASLYTGEAGRAWVWFVSSSRANKTCIGFNDV